MANREGIILDQGGSIKIDGVFELNNGLEGTVSPPTTAYDHSYQADAFDLNVDAAIGDNTNTHFFAGGMWSILGASLTKTKNYLGGVIGVLGVTGTQATTYPVGAVHAMISDGVTKGFGVVAYIDGDDSTTTADAMYKVMCNNSTAASGASFGLDLQDAAHDGYIPVDASFYKSAPVRIVSDVCFLIGAAAPTNGTTGANITGPGSLYFATTTPKLYINTNTKASPTWTVVGTQS
jgi:hypothetical protein